MDIKRKIVTRSPHRRVGIIASPWLQSEPIEYESLLERDFVRLALLAPSLISIRSQPFRIDLGELGTYTPDFLVIFSRDVRLVVEVKPAEFSETEKYQKLFNAVDKKLTASGFRFCVMTENEIRKGDRHEKASVLLRYARSNFVSAEVQRVLETMNSCAEGISIAALMDRSKVNKELVLHLIGQRKLRINRHLNFSNDQLVTPIVKGKDHGNLHPAAWLGCKNRSATF